MSTNGNEIGTFIRSRINPAILRALLLLITSILTFGALILPIAIRPSQIQLKVGDVASQDILAPRSLSFPSDILTQQAKDDARNRVQLVYLPADPGITRRQIEKLRVALNFITTVRFDSYANLDQKIADINAIQDFKLSHDVMEKLLGLSDNRWQTIQQESLSVLEQVMRSTIREDQLQDALKSVPTLISFSLPEDQALVVSEIVARFVIPNSLYSADLTQQAQLQAEQQILPISRTYIAGESIVRRGQIISPLVWESLSKFGLIQSQSRDEDIWAAVTLVGLMAVFLGLYFNRRRISNVSSPKSLILLSLTFLIFLYGAKAIIPNRTILPYVYPLPAFALTVASIFNLEIGLIFPVVLSILAAYGLPNSLDLTLFYLITSLVGVLVLGKGRRIANFFWAGIAIGIAGTAVILAYRLPDTITDWLGIATLMGASLLNGLASASLTLLLQFLLAQLLGLTTSLQLMDLLRPDHPLLQLMLQTMPGSYQHSLQVANLAERAAESIGADPLLTRAGAIYHDAGKASNPEFFIENQVHGKIDSHEDQDPVTSAQIIIQHVSDGLVLAKKFRLPPRIQDFIREHHGTLMTRYQYSKALEANGGDSDKVDINQFQYPGPSPRSRETALLMLADQVEAHARAEIPRNEDDLRIVIKKTIDYCTREGQLDHTNLTLRDINTIIESFLSTLRNTYHQRIRYPDLKPTAAAPSRQETIPAPKKSTENAQETE